MTPAVFVVKKRPKTAKTGPCGPALDKKKRSKALVKGVRVV